MQEMTLSAVRKDLSKVVAQCHDTEGVVITVHGKPAACIVSARQYEELKKKALERELEPIFSEFDSLFKALSNK